MQVTPLVGGPSADSFEGEANKFAQNHVVTLPSKQCDNCYLRCGAGKQLDLFIILKCIITVF